MDATDFFFGNAQREAAARLAAEQLRGELAISHLGFGFVAAAQAHAEMAELQRMLIADARSAMGLIRLDCYRIIDSLRQFRQRTREALEQGKSHQKRRP